LPNNAAPPKTPAVTSVSRRDGNWIVRLRGPNKNYAVLTLDSAYKLVAARIVDKQLQLMRWFLDVYDDVPSLWVHGRQHRTAVESWRLAISFSVLLTCQTLFLL